MTTYQYIHPTCNLKKSSDFTHISRSVDTNVCNPMSNNLSSKLVPLTFNYNAEIQFPLGMCNNTLLQIGPVREDHGEEQLWNNYQFKKHYAQNYNREHTLLEYNARRGRCESGGRIGCNRMDNEIISNFLVNDINRSEALQKGGVTTPVQSVQSVTNKVI